jgi:hypothetical protein
MIELLALRSHFGLINDNARTYCEMSQAYIMPTSRRINSTPLTVDADAQRKAIAQLTKSASEAADAVMQRLKT